LEAKRKVNLKRFSLTFWTVFIGISVVMGGITFLAFLIDRNISQPISNSYNTFNDKIFSERHNIIELANLYLKKRLDKIIDQAIKKTCSELKQDKYLKKFSQYLSSNLNSYFRKIERNNIPKFLDWLYAWGTDYKIAYHSALKLIRGEDNYLQRKIEILLFNPYDFRVFVKNHIFPEMQKEYNQFEEEIKEKLIENIKKLSKQELKSKYPQLSDSTIDEILSAFFNNQKEQIEKDISKRVGSKIIAHSILFKILKRLSEKLGYIISIKISKKIAAKIVEKIGAKLGSKVGSKAVGGVSAFAAGVGACIELGPLSVVCGIGAALAADLVADYAITKLDELMNRDESQRELINLLEQSKKQAYKEIMGNFEELLIKSSKAFCSITLKDVVK
jgi:uncharacterized membrane protein YheB (UPF0754 family)